jgi:hypothetical protein
MLQIHRKRTGKIALGFPLPTVEWQLCSMIGFSERINNIHIQIVRQSIPSAIIQGEIV